MAEQDPSLEADNPESQRPEWLPENFKSPEDFAASYKESQRKITELAQEKKGLEDAFAGLSQQFEEFTASQNQPDPDLARARLEEAYAMDPLGVMAQIAQSTAQTILDQQRAQQGQQGIAPEEYSAFVADQTLAQKYGQDWNAETKKKVGELIASDPLYHQDHIWTNPQLATHAYERAYESVRLQELLSGNEIVQQQMQDTRQMKLNSQSAVGASGRPEAPAVNEWEQIKNAAPKNYWE